MSKTTQTEAVKASKKYAKTRGEHYKDLVICALVVGIVAFIGGNVFASKQSAEIRNAVSTAQATASQVEAATPTASK